MARSAALIGPRTVVLDLKGRTVIPGLIDCTFTCSCTALCAAGCDGVRSPEEAAQRVLLSKGEPAGEWISARGIGCGRHCLPASRRLMPLPEHR